MGRERAVGRRVARGRWRRARDSSRGARPDAGADSARGPARPRGASLRRPRLSTSRGRSVFGFNRTLTLADGRDRRGGGGQARSARPARSRTALTPGRYFVHCYAARSREQGDIALHQLRLFDFVVYGPQRWKGSVTVDADVEADARAMTDASLELRDVRGPSALGGGWRRVFDLLWLIAAHRVPPHLPRHRARLPVVARPAADAVRRPAGRVHAGVRPRRAGATSTPCCCCSTSCCSASSRSRR